MRLYQAIAPLTYLIGPFLVTSCGLFGEPAPPEDDDATTRIDHDGDGYAVTEGDCDDQDPGRHPDALERCDSVDNDCNGLSDDGAQDAWPWYADRDADSFGDPESSSNACTAPSGYVANAGDCDDTQPSVHAGAQELCGDTFDNDCDGEVDENLLVWYLDQDTDSFGNSSAALRACDSPPGTVADGTDCDDTDPDRYPGAVEDCGTDVDLNCDGRLTDCGIIGDLSLAYADATWEGTSGETAGEQLATGDVDQDGLIDILIGAPASNSEGAAGSAYLNDKFPKS